MRRKKQKINKTLKEIESLMDSLKKEDDIRFVFSYISIGNTLNDLHSKTITNVQDDLASNALRLVIDEKIYGNPIEMVEKSEIEQLEDIAKLHMFNIFNGKNKPEA